MLISDRKTAGNYKDHIARARDSFKNLVFSYETQHLAGERARFEKRQFAEYDITLWGQIGRELCSWAIEKKLLDELYPNKRNDENLKLKISDLRKINMNSYREYMINVLNSIGIDIFTELALALEDLNQGHVTEIFQPNKDYKGKHGSQQDLAELKEAVVRWKYYFYGAQKGKKSIKRAEGDVAKYIGFSDAQIRKIDREFKKLFPNGYDEIKDIMICAGKFYFRVYKNPNKPTNKAVEKFILEYCKETSNNRKSYKFNRDKSFKGIAEEIKRSDEELPKLALRLLDKMYPLWDLGIRLRKAGMKSATKF